MTLKKKNKKIKIAFAVTSRGNYAKIKGLLELVSKSKKFESMVILGGMIVLEKYGRILDVINNKNFKVVNNINYVVEGESLLSMTKSSGLACLEFANIFNNSKPDVLVLIGDRFECLPIAMTASYMNISIAHIEGGEISGSIDEKIRHAITKLSDYHFACSRKARKNIIKMGEYKQNVFNVGSTSFDEFRKINLNNLKKVREIQKNLGIGNTLKLEKKKYLILIQHPVTTEYNQNYKHMIETIEALKKIKMETIWIMPNMDAGSNGINRAIREFRERNKTNYVHYFKSLPIEYFGPLLNNAACIFGNSSSGIREASFLGIPAVNIGNRQNNREKSHNVIDCDYDRNQIYNALLKQIKKKRIKKSYNYGNGYSSLKIYKILSRVKKFNTLKVLKF
jgi:UDP-hydrolysing UDP-N-acetyl-D-glucosamine 2-epimerase